LQSSDQVKRISPGVYALVNQQWNIFLNVWGDIRKTDL
jgi:hypothetical protein